MKLKQQPDDFHVEELTDVTPGPDGPFAFYRLEKTGWSTPDALAAIRRRWHLDPIRISFGGLKDRHARTVQYLTIAQGPRRDLEHDRVRLSYLGQVGSPYASADFRGNRFRITLRDLPEEQRALFERRLEQIRTRGVPNYFDDQRFGSVAMPGGPWIARLLVERRFEDALRLALLGEYEHDRAAEKQVKRLLTAHWGDWKRLEAVLPCGHARDLAAYLHARPGDFKGAVVRLRPELRGLYLSAYQSHLWNLCLARVIEAAVPEGMRRGVALRTGPVPFFDDLPEAVAEKLESLSLPLPTARWKPAPDDPRLPVVEEVLAREGLTLRDLQVRGVRELFFSKGERAALCRPANLAHEWGPDERHPGRGRLTLSFDLTRGSYATIVVKAVTA
jgi:tRNA pseudouridine13 synthase